MKPRSAFILFLALIAAALTYVFATGARDPGEPPPNPYPDVDWAAVKDDPSQKLAISWLGTPTFPTGEEGTYVERVLEERFNIDLKPIFLDVNAFNKRRPLMFGAGDIPDVYRVHNPIHVQRDVHHGFALEIPYEVILKYAPNYVRQLNRHAPQTWLYTNVDGKNYGLPNFMTHGHFPCPSVWRMDWLRAVGFDHVPRTLEEAHEALYRFRHNDPDGNGLKDTYGMTPDARGWWLSFSEIYGAFGVIPFDWMERDGRIVWGGLLPETKEALAVLHQWYEEEIIKPDFVAMPQGGEKRQFLNGVVGYIYNYGSVDRLDKDDPESFYNMMMTLARKEGRPEPELAVGRYLIGPHGDRGGRIWGTGGQIIMFGAPISRRPEKVIRVLRMFDELMVDKDLFLKSRCGLRGEHWDYSPQRGIYPLPPYDEREITQKYLLAPHLDVSNGFYVVMGAPLEWVDEYLPKCVPAFRAKYRRPEWGIQNVFFKSDVTPSAGIYLNDLLQMQLTVFTEIIRGDRPVEYFETFKKNWLKQGGAILLKEARALRVKQMEIYRKVGVDPDDRIMLPPHEETE